MQPWRRLLAACGYGSLTKDRSGRKSRNDSGTTRKLRTARTDVEQQEPFGSARTTGVVHWRGRSSSVGQLRVCRFVLGGQCERTARENFLRGGLVLTRTRPFRQRPSGLESASLNGCVRPQAKAASSSGKRPATTPLSQQTRPLLLFFAIWRVRVMSLQRPSQH